MPVCHCTQLWLAGYLLPVAIRQSSCVAGAKHALPEFERIVVNGRTCMLSLTKRLSKSGKHLLMAEMA